MAEKRQPWMKFYPADWRADPALRMCSRAARSLWIDLMGLMHEAEPYGFLLIKGTPPTIQQIADMVGGTPKELDRLRGELQTHGVFSRIGDDDLPRDLMLLVPTAAPRGTIFSRRMVRDWARSEEGRLWVSKRRDRQKPRRDPNRAPDLKLPTQSPDTRNQTSDGLRNPSGGEPPEADSGIKAASLDPKPPPIPLFMHRPPSGDYAWLLFNPGLEWLQLVYGEHPAKLRAVIGRWNQLAADDHKRVWEAMVRCQAEAIADPKAWVVAALGGKVADGSPAPRPPQVTTVGAGETDFQRRHREWRDGGRQGPEPQPGDVPETVS